MKPLVVRIDEIGRAQAVNYDALTYKPAGQAPELKYFLVQFVTKHCGRMRATVKSQYAESLYFLEAGLAEATIASDQRSGHIERFLTSTSMRSRSRSRTSRSTRSDNRRFGRQWSRSSPR